MEANKRHPGSGGSSPDRQAHNFEAEIRHKLSGLQGAVVVLAVVAAGAGLVSLWLAVRSINQTVDARLAGTNRRVVDLELGRDHLSLRLAALEQSVSNLGAVFTQATSQTAIWTQRLETSAHEWKSVSSNQLLLERRISALEAEAKLLRTRLEPAPPTRDRSQEKPPSNPPP